jgi:glycosyltransferase involved in cell wall biosynthesis
MTDARHAIPPPLVHRSGWPWDQSRRPALRTAEIVSVVTPSYQQGEFIEETIRSVLLQGRHVEHIVVDAGSTDGTLAVLRHYSAHIKWISEPDAGQADGINKGLRLATGSIVAYLNADDTYVPDTIGCITWKMREHPHLGLVYGNCMFVDSEGRALGTLRGAPVDVDGMIRRGDFIPQQAAFWRRSVIDVVGEFDAGLRYCMDHDFFIRVVRAFPVGCVGKTLATFRLHSHSKTVAQSEAHWREAIAVSRRYGMTPRTWAYWIRHIRHYGGRALPKWVQPAISRRTLRMDSGITSLE